MTATSAIDYEVGDVYGHDFAVPPFFAHGDQAGVGQKRRYPDMKSLIPNARDAGLAALRAQERLMLETLVDHALTQGIIRTRVTPEELFARTTRDLVA
jgi:hypothetical protein